VRFDLDLLTGRDLVGDAFGKLDRERPVCAFDRLGVRVEGEHARDLMGDAECEPAVAAADLSY
jgi:hypothetical protein